MQLEGLGERCKLPQRIRGGAPAANVFCGYFKPENVSVGSDCRAMLCKRAAYAVMRCLSVCLSVTFVDHVKMNKRIFKIFSPSVDKPF